MGVIISESDNTLTHYGVKGMKWGIIRDREKAYERAKKKLDRLAQKTTKAGHASTDYARRSVDLQVRRSRSSSRARDWNPALSQKRIRRLTKKSNRYYSKYAKNLAKTTKWMDTMEAEFKDLHPEDFRRGRRGLRRKKGLDFVSRLTKKGA